MDDRPRVVFRIQVIPCLAGCLLWMLIIVAFIAALKLVMSL